MHYSREQATFMTLVILDTLWFNSEMCPSVEYLPYSTRSWIPKQAGWCHVCWGDGLISSSLTSCAGNITSACCLSWAACLQYRIGFFIMVGWCSCLENQEDLVWRETYTENACGPEKDRKYNVISYISFVASLRAKVSLFLFSESFTADHKPLMGEAPEVRGFFLGCGFNSAGMFHISRLSTS